MTVFRKISLGCAVVISGLWVANTSVFYAGGSTTLIAHRGVHQIYAGDDRTADTCTANPVKPADHGLIANTPASIIAAFDAGAEVVEIDVHRTTDGKFAVFHDWTLDCQTDGTGVTHKQTMAYLQTLDLGYGYRVDGVTYPLRGTAVGAMPTLDAILSANYGPQYLINFKGNRASEGKALGAVIAPYRAQVFGVYGGQEPTDAARAADLSLIGFDKSALLSCGGTYALTGWTGYVPAACRDRLIAVPLDYGPYLWGWPHRFTDRMKRAGTTVIL